MDSVTVMEFYELLIDQDVPIWPPQKVTRLTSPASMTTQPRTQCVVVTTSANTQMTMDGAIPNSGDIPIINGILNVFPMVNTVVSPNANSVTLTFA